MIGYKYLQKILWLNAEHMSVSEARPPVDWLSVWPPGSQRIWIIAISPHHHTRPGLAASSMKHYSPALNTGPAAAGSSELLLQT